MPARSVVIKRPNGCSTAFRRLPPRSEPAPCRRRAWVSPRVGVLLAGGFAGGADQDADGGPGHAGFPGGADGIQEVSFGLGAFVDGLA